MWQLRLTASRRSLLAAVSFCLITGVGASAKEPELSRLKAPGKQLPSGSVPGKLHLSIGGFVGPFYWVDLQGDSLTYRARRYDAKAKEFKETVKQGIKPSEAQWRQFWKALEEAHTWQWQANYPAPPFIADGTQWSVELDWAGRSVKSTGNNNYPGKTSLQSPSSELFEKYLAGVKALLGGEDFR